MTKLIRTGLLLLTPLMFAKSMGPNFDRNFRVEIGGNLASKTWHTHSKDLQVVNDMMCDVDVRNPMYSSIYSQFYRHTAIAHQSGVKDPLYNVSLRLVYEFSLSDVIKFGGFLGVESGYDRADRTPSGMSTIAYDLGSPTAHQDSGRAVIPRQFDDGGGSLSHVIPGAYVLLHGVGPVFEYDMSEVKVIEPDSLVEKNYRDRQSLFGLRVESMFDVDDINLLVRLELLSNFKRKSETEFRAYLLDLSNQIFNDPDVNLAVDYPSIDDVHTLITKISIGVGIDLSYF